MVVSDSPLSALSLDRGDPELFLICSQRDRWPRAMRRFMPGLVPPICSVQLQQCPPSDAGDLLAGRSRAIVLWDVIPTELGHYCDLIAKTAVASPSALQLAAVTSLSPAEQAALSELGVDAMVRHPEDLPKLGRLIHVYFAGLQ